MPNYRRWYVPGGTYFLTVVTEGRRPLFTGEHPVESLRSAIRQVRSEWPFDVTAAVILPDHMHFLWALPGGDDEYPKRLGRMKALFTRALPAIDPKRHSDSVSRQSKRESDVWQRRYWEHTIRNDDDFKDHLDYIHYNPVKHGYVFRPADWRWSSFLPWVQKGEYDLEWGEDEVRADVMDRIAARSGE